MNRYAPLSCLFAALLVGCQSARTSTESAQGNDSIFQHVDPKTFSSMEHRVEPPDEALANGKFFYFFGFGASRQGRFPWTGRDTVMSALAQAGFGDGNWPQQVRLSRPGTNGRENATAIINFPPNGDRGTLGQNYLIHEGDIIHIPDAPLHKMRCILRSPIRTVGDVGTEAVVTNPTGRLK